MLARLLQHRLVKDSLVLFGVQVTGYVLPLVTLPYLSRVLGPDNFGLLALGTALILYFSVVVEYGFAVIGPRQVAVQQEDPAAIARIYSNIMACKMLLLVGSALVLVGVVAVVPEYRSYWPLYLLSFLQVVGWGLSPNWLLQGMQEIKYVAYSDYGAKLLSVILIFVLVRQKSDYLIAAALQSGGYLIAAMIALSVVFLKLGVRLTRPDVAGMRAVMREGWPVFLSMASLTVMTSSNTVILGALASNAQVGFFAAAQRLIIAARALTNPVTTAVYPHMSKLAAASPREALRFFRKQVLLTGGPFLAVTLGLLVLAPWVVQILYGSQYAESGVLLRIMSFTPVIHALSVCVGTYYMLAFGFEKAWSRIITVMVVLNFVVLGGLVMVLTPARAVALTSVVMDLFAAAACWRFYFRTVKQVREKLPEESPVQETQGR